MIWGPLCPQIFISPAHFLWRGSLLPFGCEAVANPSHSVYLIHLGCRFWGRFATQRAQAPSPQVMCSTVTWWDFTHSYRKTPPQSHQSPPSPAPYAADPHGSPATRHRASVACVLATT